jgi:hypothetical protein
MNRLDAGIKNDVDIDIAVREASVQFKKSGLYGILRVNEKPMYLELDPPFIKPVGDLSLQRMTEILCDCGCRLNTDGSLYWCSGLACSFIGREETF